ncbi:hypothetical protein B0H13DRAFT_2398619 [Mycena leptocephala]|nr:hypothetical protein B0H13DRAFT_2398619 [Mycena leptocephala]
MRDRTQKVLKTWSRAVEVVQSEWMAKPEWVAQSESDAIPDSTPVYKDKHFVVLSNWDGTITTQDWNDCALARAAAVAICAHQKYRDAFCEMLASIVANGDSFEACKEVLRTNIKLDAGFKGFNAWCRLSLFLGIPLSLFFMLGNLIYTAVGWHLLSARCFNLGDDAVADSIDIIANDVEIHPDDKWNIKFRHPTMYFIYSLPLVFLLYFEIVAVTDTTSLSQYYHTGPRVPAAAFPFRQKCLRLVLPYPFLHAHDPTADMSAARHANVLFVKQKDDHENDLAAY